MIRLLIFFLAAHFSFAGGDDCDYGYYRVDSETCLHPAGTYRRFDDREGYCSSISPPGTPFGRPINDEMWKNINLKMKEGVEFGRYDAYIGLKKKVDSNSWDGSNDKTWTYVATGEEFNVDEYPLWSPRKPVRSEDCAAITSNDNLNVKPTSCEVHMKYLCEKEKEPCEPVGNYWYADYYGRCLVVMLIDDNSYANIENSCPKGFLAPMKDESERKSIAPAFYNAFSMGGFYVGLQKKDDGNWIYDNGQAEDSRWDPDDPRQWDCGVVRMLSNGSLGMYSMDCERQMSFFCEIRVSAKN